MIGYLIGRGHEKAGHYQLSITALQKKKSILGIAGKTKSFFSVA